MTNPTTILDAAPIARLDLAMFEPAPGNRHTDDRDPETRELADSMRSVGQLQPIIARRLGDGEPMQILAGERRWRAARLAGLATIEAKIVTCDDRLAQEITIVENLQRKNLTPLEEADVIHRLLAISLSPGDIAAHLGKSPAWVVRRAKLIDLSPTWIGNQQLDWATTGHLELVARLPRDLQDDLAQQDFYAPPSIKELDQLIANRYLHLLRTATWKTDDADLVSDAGPCDACTKRSCHQQLLFGDSTGPTDRCLDATCWKRKVDATTRRTVDKLIAKHDQVVVLTDHHDLREQADIPLLRELPAQARVVPSTSYIEHVTKTAPGAMPAVDGTTGKAVWIRPHSYASDETRKALGLPVKARAGKNAKADKASVSNEQINRARREAKRYRLRCELLAEALDKTSRPDLTKLLRMALVFLVDHADTCQVNTWQMVNARCDQDTVCDDLWNQIRQELRHIELRPIQSTSLPDRDGFAAFETFAGLDPSTQESLALDQIPEPKPRKPAKKSRKGAA